LWNTIPFALFWNVFAVASVGALALDTYSPVALFCTVQPVRLGSTPIA
jgi:hypothetical protein